MENRNISVVRVRDILFVTVPPEPDDNTITELQQQVLQVMEQYEPRGLILDISMVDTLDSFFARTISETTQMVTLMGGMTIVAGMHPSVAITAAQLGLNLGGALTALDVDCAVNIFTDIHQGVKHGH